MNGHMHMEPDPKTQSFNDNLQTGSARPPLPASEPPVIGDPPPLSVGSLPLVPPKPTPDPGAVRQMIAFLLSLFLGLFLADAVLSLVNDSLILCFGVHLLAGIQGMVWLFAMLMALVIYGLMGLAPMIPRRLFLPVTLFYPAGLLLAVPLCLYFYDHIWQADWVISFCQVIFGLSILCLVQGGFKFRWPLVAEKQLGARRFSWRHLAVFLLANVLVLLPGIIVYLVLCAALAVNHFSEGFLTLQPGGLTVQARQYVRKDGKTIHLIPMAHVGEVDFYRKLSQSFPTNSIILMEGVTDRRNLLTNELTYKRMATSLGVAEQDQEFNPTQGELVWADVDVEQFTTNTIGLLNLCTLIHSKGMTVDAVLKLMRFSAPPHFEEQLRDDLLRKRNRRVLEELRARLPQSEHIMVPWGVAHMPGIAAEIQKSGFCLDKTQQGRRIKIRPHFQAFSPVTKKNTAAFWHPNLTNS